MVDASSEDLEELGEEDSGLEIFSNGPHVDRNRPQRGQRSCLEQQKAPGNC